MLLLVLEQLHLLNQVCPGTVAGLTDSAKILTNHEHLMNYVIGILFEIRTNTYILYFINFICLERERAREREHWAAEQCTKVYMS